MQWGKVAIGVLLLFGLSALFLTWRDLSDLEDDENQTTTQLTKKIQLKTIEETIEQQKLKNDTITVQTNKDKNTPEVNTGKPEEKTKTTVEGKKDSKQTDEPEEKAKTTIEGKKVSKETDEPKEKAKATVEGKKDSKETDESKEKDKATVEGKKDSKQTVESKVKAKTTVGKKDSKKTDKHEEKGKTTVEGKEDSKQTVEPKGKAKAAVEGSKDSKKTDQPKETAKASIEPSKGGFKKTTKGIGLKVTLQPSASKKPFIGGETARKKHPAVEKSYMFNMLGNKSDPCFLTLGNCLAMGCDGVVWSAQATCSNGKSMKVALKLYRSPKDIIDQNIDIDHEIQQRLQKYAAIGENLDKAAITLSRVRFPAGELQNTLGTCRAVNKTDPACNELTTLFWRKPEKLITASVMPFASGVPFIYLGKGKKFKKNAIAIFHNLASSFQMMQQTGIFHCDLRTDHVLVKGNRTTVVDFGRIRLCSESLPSSTTLKKYHVKECETRDRMQMFIFGSFILDFCQKKNAKTFDYAGPAYFHNAGICYGKKALKSFHKEINDRWKTLFEKRLKTGIFGCPHPDKLLDLVKYTYSPFRNSTYADWTYLLKQFENLLVPEVATFIPTSSVQLRKNDKAPSKGGKVDTRIPFLLYGNKNEPCFLTLGSCVAMGCDGVVWSGEAVCRDKKQFKIGLKLYRSETAFIDKNMDSDNEIQTRLQKFSGPNHRLESMASTISRVQFPVGRLKSSTGTCRTTDSIPKDCFHISTQFWKNPNKIITASVMPFITGSSLESTKAKNKVASIFHSYASTMHILQQSGIYHCDLRMDHVVVNGNKSSPTISIVDFGRMRTCTTRGQYMNKNNRGHVQDCDIRDKMNMFIFGSMLLDFCQQKGKPGFNYAGPAYFHNAGVCFPMSYVNRYVKEVHDKWESMFAKRIRNGMPQCPNEKVLLEVVNFAYSPLKNSTDVNWNRIKDKLKSIL